MTQQHHLNHATWDCKYHVVFIPKYRKKAVLGKIKKNLGAVFHDLARRRECRPPIGSARADGRGNCATPKSPPPAKRSGRS